MEVVTISAIDTKTKEYMRQPKIFADMFNYLIYDGQPVISSENLKERDTTEMALPFGNAGKLESVQKYRDVLKDAILMESDGVAYLLILGIENQTDVHYAMPVKNMIYDALNYGRQVTELAKKHKENKDKMSASEFLSGIKMEDKLIPVITLTVYFGQEKWNGALSIHEMLTACKPEVLKYVQDYKINLIAPVSMSAEDVEKFQTDFKQLATIIRCANDKEALKASLYGDENFKHMDKLTADIASAVTNVKIKSQNKEEGAVNMCKAIEDWMAEERAEGKAKGKAEGRRSTLIELVRDGILNAKVAAEKLGMTEKDFCDMMHSA